MTVVEKLRSIAKPSDDSIQQAMAGARKAIDGHSQGQQRIARLEVELHGAVETESAGAVEALEAGTEVPAIGKAANLGMQIEILKRACDVARSKALESITGIYRAGADGERGLAEEKREQRERLLKKVTAALAVLSELEEIQYSPFILRAMPQGVWEGVFTGAQPDFDSCGPRDVVCRGGAINAQPYAIPKSERLSAEIKAHETRVAVLAEQRIDPSGDLNEVLETVVREVTPAAKAEAA
jgi:hypothetical protein